MGKVSLNIHRNIFNACEMRTTLRSFQNVTLRRK